MMLPSLGTLEENVFECSHLPLVGRLLKACWPMAASFYVARDDGLILLLIEFGEAFCISASKF